jgi:NAD(P)H-flavin reductase
MSAALHDPFTPSLYRVGRVQRELSDTVTLELAPVTGQRPGFQPGQFNMIYVFGVGEVAISMSGDPAAALLVHTVREVGKVSSAIAQLQPGRTVGVRGPYGTAWPVEQAAGSDMVIMAGGLGLAPLRPAIYHVLANRNLYGRVAILFGTRQPTEMLFRPELEQWRQRLDVQVEVTVDHAEADWRGNVGVVPALIPRTPIDPDHAVAMVCGPEIMMRFTIDALRQRGLAMDRIFVSMERNMKCAVGLCGRCQFGPAFVCRDGPVFRYDRIAALLNIREI